MLRIVERNGINHSGSIALQVSLMQLEHDGASSLERALKKPHTANLNSTNHSLYGNVKRKDYLSWEEYFMALAYLTAQRSKDPYTQVGAVIVNQDRKVVGLGYNGMPTGCSDDILPWGKDPSNFLESKNAYVCHAEMNAFVNKNCESAKGSTIYTIMFPCNECAKIIIQGGIREVVYIREKSKEVEVASKRLFDMAGVRYRRFQSNRKIAFDFGEMCGYIRGKDANFDANASPLKQITTHT